ncbi:MAG: GDSL-type esterase/lipase family protein [Elainellaceae cyanobacterium]
MGFQPLDSDIWNDDLTGMGDRASILYPDLIDYPNNQSPNTRSTSSSQSSARISPTDDGAVASPIEGVIETGDRSVIPLNWLTTDADNSSLDPVQPRAPRTNMPNARPTAKLKRARNIREPGNIARNIKVVYNDSDGIDFSSIGSNDIKIMGPGLRTRAELVRVRRRRRGRRAVATYRIEPPANGWESDDNGTYKIILRRRQVKDDDGKFARRRNIGQFTVNVQDPTPPPPPLPPPPPPPPPSPQPPANPPAGRTLESTATNNIIVGDARNELFIASAGSDSFNGGLGIDTISYADVLGSVTVDLRNNTATKSFPVSSSDIEFLPLGDSNTRGFPNQSGNGGYRTKLWRDLNTQGFQIDFIGRLASGPGDIDRDHEGRGGFTIDQLTDGGGSNFPQPPGTTPPNYQNIEVALNGNPNVVLLMAGTNDAFSSDTVDTMINELGVLVNRILADQPNAYVLVASPIPNFANPTVQSKTQQFSSRISGEIIAPRVAAGEKVFFVDIFNTPGLSQSTDYQPDGFHLDPSGYDKIADVWFNSILAATSGTDTLTGIEHVVGSDYNDTLIGDIGNNILRGGRGNDVMFGNFGNDMFVFAPNEGTDIITDFTIGQDFVGLTGGLSLNQVSIVQSATNTLLNAGGNLFAVLNNVQASTLTSSSFVAV